MRRTALVVLLAKVAHMILCSLSKIAVKCLLGACVLVACCYFLPIRWLFCYMKILVLMKDIIWYEIFSNIHCHEPICINLCGFLLYDGQNVGFYLLLSDGCKESLLLQVNFGTKFREIYFLWLQDIIQEQITRVLLERLIVNRPHPWGLLITFIELIKVPSEFCGHVSFLKVLYILPPHFSFVHACRIRGTTSGTGRSHGVRQRLKSFLNRFQDLVVVRKLWTMV